VVHNGEMPLDRKTKVSAAEMENDPHLDCEVGR